MTFPGMPAEPSYRNSLDRMLKARQMTHRELSVRSGVSRERITQLVNGKKAHNLSTVVAVAWGLGVHPTEMQDLIDKRVPLGPRGREKDPERTCLKKGCDVVLSRYSTSLRCTLHELLR